MNTRFIDWIWRIRGSLALAPGQSSKEAFEKLDPLFREPGTWAETHGDTLVFRKTDPVAQDKMAVFDAGEIVVDRGDQGPVLRYNLFSKSLLFCFLAPLMFLAFAQVNIMIGELNKSDTEAAASAKKPEQAKKPPVPLHPIDKFLGAPEPDKEGASKVKRKKNSPTPGYVFAGIFVALYVGGRILEDRLIKSLFRKRLLGA